MSQERFELRRDQYLKALARLHESLRLEDDAAGRPAAEREAFRDSAIQRFEFTYERAWNAMKEWLATKLIEVTSPRDTFSNAFANKLISDETGWSEIHRYRNLTSHTYDEAKALELNAFIRAKAIGLFDELAAKLKAS